MSNEIFELQYVKYIEDILCIKTNLKQPLKSRLRDVYLKLSNYIDATEVIFETFNKEVYGDEDEDDGDEDEDDGDEDENTEEESTEEEN